VIDGATNSATVLPVAVASNQFAYAVAVNPVTNKIYFTIASDGNTPSGSVGVIDGATNNITYIADLTALYDIAVNPVTNKIYVPNGQSVTVIDGATNHTVTLPSTGNAALFVAVNPITNKIYVPNTFSGTLMVIDGATNGITTLPGGPGTVSGPFAVVVNPTTNKIYLPCIDSLTIVDGATNTETSVSLPAATTGYSSTAVNPVTNKAYVAFPNSDSDPVTVAIIQEENVEPLPLTTAIAPLPNNQTTSTTPTFDFTAQSGTVSVPDSVYYQVDTWQNGWTKAKGANPMFDGTLARLQPGFHILFAFSGDGQQATSTELSPLVGSVQAYGFLVASPVTFAGVDTATQGNWTGVYGSAGYLIANAAPSYLNYATVNFAGDFSYTWAGATSDPRAPQTATGASSRIASAYTQYYNTPFSFNININDDKPHQVALYLLDWDSSSRNETITISDASTGQVYDSETFSNFHNGEWAIWNVKGNLTFTITPNAAPAAAVSGIFFN
jgi:DNA-binding beta-propeller fold protein YncE